MTSQTPDDDANRAVRIRRLAAGEGAGLGVRVNPAAWAGQPTAIYCRLSQAADDDQTGVDRQERICREVAARLGLNVAAGHVFVDNNRSAWKRNRKRKGWDALLEAARNREVGHIVAYHPDRLMRQPRDLEELLSIADDHNITLHGQANRRDLSDPDDRFFLRIEVAHACRSSDDTSRRLKSAMIDRARDGLPHSGRRRYGYSPDGMSIDPDQAEIVKEIFASYLDGDPPATIAQRLNARGVPSITAGKPWEDWRVLRVIDSRHVAGIRRFRGQDIGRGAWEAIIDAGTFAEAQERRTFRADANTARSRPQRVYLLRGLVVCRACGVRMTGTTNGAGLHTYACGRAGRHDGSACSRSIGAKWLEPFVADAAMHMLENLTVTGDPAAPASHADTAADTFDAGELAELRQMWEAQELPTREYRQMRAVIEARITARAARTVVRPAASILAGITGPGARASWQHLADTGQHERQNAILRFLFAAVLIGENTIPGRFDYSRIDIEPNPL